MIPALTPPPPPFFYQKKKEKKKEWKKKEWKKEISQPREYWRSSPSQDSAHYDKRNNVEFYSLLLYKDLIMIFPVAMRVARVLSACLHVDLSVQSGRD